MSAEQEIQKLWAEIARIQRELTAYHHLMMSLRQGWLLSVDHVEKLPSVSVSPRTSELRKEAKGK